MTVTPTTEQGGGHRPARFAALSALAVGFILQGVPLFVLALHCALVVLSLLIP